MQLSHRGQFFTIRLLFFRYNCEKPGALCATIAIVKSSKLLIYRAGAFAGQSDDDCNCFIYRKVFPSAASICEGGGSQRLTEGVLGKVKVSGKARWMNTPATAAATSP